MIYSSSFFRQKKKRQCTCNSPFHVGLGLGLGLVFIKVNREIKSTSEDGAII
jgi:hypothetical protein